jgi:Holliday junction DNA helicase RuvB
MARQPRTFNRFIGQRRVVSFVKRLIQGAKIRGAPCPSLLLIGRSGAGKTVLARAVAREYGSAFHRLFAGEDLRPIDICNTLAALKHGDILFLDEGHSLNRDAQQVLYLALDEQKAPAINNGRIDRSRITSIAAFTLIIATNQPGGVKPALRRRLTSVEFAPYSTRELVAVARTVAADDRVEITAQAARRLAEVAQGSPRRVHQRIDGLRHFWPEATRFTQQHVARFLTREGVDARGLTENQRLYLRALAASSRGTCSLRGLETRLGCDGRYVQEEIELHLVDRGWVEVTSGAGRRITQAGRAIVRELVAEKGTEVVS